MINPELLKILICPVTGEDLHAADDFLVSAISGVKYPVRGGIPIMLIESKQVLAEPVPAETAGLEVARR